MTSSSSSPLARSASPRRGDVWLADLDPVRGREQAGRRTVLILSDDAVNDRRRALVVTVPLSTQLFTDPLHLRIAPPEGGIDRASEILVEHIRTISTTRLSRRLGSVGELTLRGVERRLRALLVLNVEQTP